MITISKRALIIGVCALLLVAALAVGAPFAVRRIRDIGYVFVGEEWTQVGSYSGGKGCMLVDFHSSQGPSRILVRMDSCEGGVWTEGGTVPLKVGFETVFALTDAQEYRFYACNLEGYDGGCRLVFEPY